MCAAKLIYRPRTVSADSQGCGLDQVRHAFRGMLATLEHFETLEHLGKLLSKVARYVQSHEAVLE